MTIDHEFEPDSAAERPTELERTPVAIDPDLLPTNVTNTAIEPSAQPSEPIDPRRYIELRPSESPTDPRALLPAMDSLYDLLQHSMITGLFDRFRPKPIRPRVEFLLVSDGRSDPALRYLIGSNDPALTEQLISLLRTAFPDSYEFRMIDWHPRYLEEALPVVPVRPRTNTRRQEDRSQHPSITSIYPYVAGVEFAGHLQRKNDWQTPLMPFESFSGAAHDANGFDAYRIPLSRLIETMVDAELPVIYQVVFRQKADWTKGAATHLDELEVGSITKRDKLLDALFTPTKEASAAYRPPPADQQRIDGISNRDPRRTFVVSVRAAVLTTSEPSRADAAAHRLSNALSSLSGRFHTIEGHVRTDDELHSGRGHPPGSEIYRQILDLAISPPIYSRWVDSVRRRPLMSNGIVVAPEELPGFLAIDGAGLTPDGRRALAARPTERTGLPLPAAEQLVRYRGPGMALGMPITHDRLPYDHPLYLPTTDQDRHVIVIGPTGSGKSVLTETAMLTNTAATDGPAILIDFKGGGTATEYLKAHYQAFGSLERVSYFDCTKVIPAISVLDIGPLLAAGIPREEARSRIAGHYEEMLVALMGSERYYQAVESPRVITHHLRALFDPVHGSEAVAHHGLYYSLLRTLRDEAPPPVSEDRLAAYFASLLDRDRDVFNLVLGGALNRVETIATDGRLAPMFDHVPEADEPSFDFMDVIDEDRVVIFDLGGMDDRAKRALTLALLSNLWRALQARANDPTTPAHPPLVNCYIEEAGALASSALLDTLLSQGRSFGLSMFLGVQHLGQLDSPNPDSRTREEALNETATILAGQVAVRDDLVDALASDALPPNALNRRLSRMARGEWLVRPATAFGADSVRPFLIESLSAPAGHPASTEPLEAADKRAFDLALTEISDLTRDAHGLPHPVYTPPDSPDDEPPRSASLDVTPRPPIGSCYANSKRFPEPVIYREATNALHCRSCDNRYDPDIQGMIRAIECCASLDDVDRDDIPPGDLTLKLSDEERQWRSISDAQLRMLQAVYNAMQGRFDPLEYDLTSDSMLRLQEYVGIEPDEVVDLVDEGLLRVDTDHPYRLYSVTPAGRDAIGESYREGTDYGHGLGDLEESSPHILGVILAERYLERTYLDDPESPVTTVQRYHDIGGNQRLDAVALDADGSIVVAVEVERVNNDVGRAVPDDFDKMASCDPDDAIWIVMSHTAGHKVLSALNDPLDGDPRVTKTYNKNTPVDHFLIDVPGFTAMFTLEQIQKVLRAD